MENIIEYDYHLDKNYISNPLKFGNTLMYQIGRMYCRKETVIRTHVHMNVFELTVATDGCGVVTTNGVAVPIQKGDIYLSLPGDTHAIASSADKPLKFDFFAFHTENPALQKDLEHIIEHYYPAHTRIFHDERIKPLVSNAISEMLQGYLYAEEVLSAILSQILIYVIRGFKELAREKYSDTVSETEILCYRMMHYIDTHIYSLKHLEELSDVIGYSYGYLSAIFSKTTQRTLSDYYHEKRLDTARLLILQNELKITEISEKLNYSSLYAFSKAFTHRYGVSPRTYKKSADVRP